MHVHNEDLFNTNLFNFEYLFQEVYLSYEFCVRNVLPSPFSLENTYRNTIILKSFIYFAYSEITLNIGLLPDQK